MFTINKKKFGAFVASLRKEKGITQKSCQNNSVSLIRP